MFIRGLPYYMEFVTELKKIGLKDKEASVYLACLQLGPSPVQVIARRARVVRATTYVILESLAKLGLVTQYEEGKKTLFAAEPPRQLLRVLEKQEEDIRQKERQLETLMPQLQVLVKSTGERPSVRYFDGSEGVRAIRQEIVMYTKPGKTVLNMTNADHLDAYFPQTHTNYYRQRVAKRIHSKTIFTTTSAESKKRLLSVDFSEFSERIYVPPEHFPSPGGMTIFEDRVAMSSFSGKSGGVIVESAVISGMMRELFQLAWIGAKEVGESNVSARG